MFSRIIHKGNFTLSSGVKSAYTYEYGELSDAMNEAYCEVLLKKLLDWQKQHGKFNVLVGCETEGIRIGHQLSQLMNLPFHIMPKKRLDYETKKGNEKPLDNFLRKSKKKTLRFARTWTLVQRNGEERETKRRKRDKKAV